MAQAEFDTKSQIANRRCDALVPSLITDSTSVPQHSGCEIRSEIRIAATRTDVFPFLVDAERMKLWLAPIVSVDPRLVGIFRLSNYNGLWIEGLYLEAFAYQRVAFTWGGIEGLKIGESTVEVSLRPDAAGTVVELRHSGLSEPAFELHHLGWKEWALPKLKAVAQGGEPTGTFLGDIADAREQFAYRSMGSHPQF